jgi:hypothetical protein
VTDAELWAAWRLWTIVAGVVVLVAAALLVTIWLTARRILREARRALAVAEAIRAQTAPIWELEVSHDVAERLHATVVSLAARAERVAAALGGAAALRR